MEAFPFNIEEIAVKTPRSESVPVAKRLQLVYGDEARRVLSRALLPVYTPRAMYSAVRPPSKIYYRVYRSGDEYAVFLLYEWPDQYIPPHRYDYEPVILIMDRHLNIKEVYTDGFHYYIHRQTPPPLVSARPHIFIPAPWRSMEVRWAPPRDSDVMIYPVDEVRGTVAQTEVRYLSDRVIQELRSRGENPLAVHDRLIKNPFSARYAKHWATFDEPKPEDLARDFVKNYGLSKPEVMLMRVKLFVKTLVDKARALIAGLTSRHGEVRTGQEEVEAVAH